MIDGQTVLAVITARGGSKRCPRKNIRQFRGKPLIAWSIEEGKKSKYIDRLVLSTEDTEIAEVALHCGASVLMRCKENASDQALNEDVLREVLKRYQPETFDWVVLLQPTSPLRTVEDIDACIERAQIGDGCISYSTGNWAKNGAVYVAKTSWIENHDFSHAGLMKYLMPEERSLDIDYEEQFQ